MGFGAIIERSFWEGYATSDINIKTMFVCAVFTALIALYICFVYRLVSKKTFYDKEFHLSIFALSIITAMVILTIQSNIVVSLGMVGALSIVRFRTAVKSPMDLVFLFWSIAAGIICGAGFAMIAVIGSIVLTIGIIAFSSFSGGRECMILVINSSTDIEEAVIEAIKGLCNYKVRSRSITGNNVNLAIEVRTDEPHKLVTTVNGLDNITSVSLVEHSGEITV